MILDSEAFARKKILFPDKAKARGKRKFTGVNDRLSRACPMSVENALGAFLPTVGAFRRRRMGAKELSCKGLKL